jgi:hypothetical protein
MLQGWVLVSQGKQSRLVASLVKYTLLLLLLLAECCCCCCTSVLLLLLLNCRALRCHASQPVRGLLSAHLPLAAAAPANIVLLLLLLLLLVLQQ